MPARILVIEDNPANLELMTFLLRAFHYETLSATDGETGIALAQNESPDVIVCDIQLPRMDGLEVIRRLKSDAQTMAIPAVAVTAFAMVGDRDRVLAAGFDGYIGKPIVPETFVQQVDAFLRPELRGTVTATPPATTAWVASSRREERTILAVDDRQENLDLAESLFGTSG